MRRALGVLLATGLALVVSAGPALAHNVLVDSSPKKDSQVENSPTELKLVFDQPVQAAELVNSVTLTGPGSTRWPVGKPAVENTAVTVPVQGPLGAAGEYTVAFRILSADGHPVGDKLSFHLTKDGSGTAATTGAASPAPAAPTMTQVSERPGQDEGTPVWPWFAGAAVLLGAGVVIALRFARTPTRD
ncbi:copper resistance protein CopC [Allokutzneria sp. A3M-2-11 16]|uniref:copper resistance CopC family protein n=1 Tax=Allokutzneria sp. A3M-2-11 16 TaxID=2962043 RepID=UPI0020B81DCB|nr:copper resistance CopC family protein [Allokutzneria sp. A3M-2-11 16]MCP3799546.1 copper resistance protein CopC [Allokutzneria sp. A3M-2-11 16]